MGSKQSACIPHVVVLFRAPIFPEGLRSDRNDALRYFGETSSCLPAARVDRVRRSTVAAGGRARYNEHVDPRFPSSLSSLLSSFPSTFIVLFFSPFSLSPSFSSSLSVCLVLIPLFFWSIALYLNANGARLLYLICVIAAHHVALCNAWVSFCVPPASCTGISIPSVFPPLLHKAAGVLSGRIHGHSRNLQHRDIVGQPDESLLLRV